MMTLQQLMEAFNYQVTDGSAYGWNCYPNARYLDFRSEHADASVLFCSKTQVVYECNVDKTDSDTVVYRWINPDFKEAMLKEAAERNCPQDHAWDDTKYLDLDTSSDFLEKATAIFEGKDFDRRVEIVLDLTDEELLQIALMAHERDITFNKMVEEILRSATSWINNEQKNEQD